MSQVTTGVLIIVVGVILLGQQMRMGLDLGRLWPVFLLVLGASRFIDANGEGHRGSGAWLLLAGTLFLLNNFHVLSFHQSWPLFVVGGGLGLIFGRGRRRSRRAATPEPVVPPPVTDRFGGDGRFQS